MNYDRLASAVAAAHETYVADLRSLMFGLRMAGALTPESLLSVQRDTHRAMTDFLRAADARSSDHLVEAFDGQLTHSESVAQRMILLRPLRVIAMGEIAQLHAKIRGSGMGGLIAESGSAFAKLAKRADERFDPTAMDSAGRTWQADKLVRFLARDFGYQSYLDGRVDSLQRQGHEQAQIVYLDPSHENHRLVVALPLSDEIREQIFHPNATARLMSTTIHVPA